MKELFLLRGLPGSGKSTLANTLGGPHFEADMFFMSDSGYNFDATKLKDAHKWCQALVEASMSNPADKQLSRVIVSNTFTQEWEMDSYYALAEKYGYRVYSLIVENRHNGINEHNVPEEALTRMRNRFEVKI